MKDNSDPIYDEFAEMDFSDAKPVSKVPVLAALQAQHEGKTKVTMRIDSKVLAVFKAKAEATGGNYQTMINQALQEYAQGLTLVDVIRDTIRQELHH
ncbi:MAG TPA: BrnA antitoxin family protein [Agitococcus sp.]|nr:BrnA antitoxin family protein [Agitococcus sp.]HNI63260.1 BrnA antitoxin family protein [Agitococcus sp.]